MAETLEERVADLLSNEMGVPRRRVQPNSEIAEELGIDGDDAAELFARFGEQFGVDLELLYRNWGQHFRAEGGVSGLGFMIAVGVCTLGADLMHRIPPRYPYLLCVVVAYALYGGVYWVILRIWRREEQTSGLRPIRVSDLVDAARLGRWHLAYDQQHELFRQTE